MRRIKNLVPSFGNFDGSELIALPNFLHALYSDATQRPSTKHRATQTMAGSTPSELTWPPTFHVFFAHCLTDDHLRTAYESVTRIL